MKEDAVLFGKGSRLSGVVTIPGAARPDAPGLVLLNAGRIHRVGPNRLYVALARRAAAAGFPALRFDFSGIGESSVREDDLSFRESVVEETIEAMNVLGRRAGVERFVLAGICSGATASFQVACRDPRVVGAILVNARGYRLSRLRRLRAYARKFRRYYWKIVLLKPRRELKRLRSSRDEDLLARPRHGPAARAGEPGLERTASRGARLLIVYSEADVGLDQLHVGHGRDLLPFLKSGQIELAVVRDADHVFTLLANQRDLLGSVEGWLERTFAAPVGVERPTGARA